MILCSPLKFIISTLKCVPIAVLLMILSTLVTGVKMGTEAKSRHGGIPEGFNI